MLELDIRVTNETLESDIVGLMAHVRPEWPSDDITHKAFSGGQVNGVFGVFRKSEEENEEKEMIVVRVFALKMASNLKEPFDEERMKEFFDRGFEVKAMKVASEAGLIAPLYAQFKNGVVYGFAAGDVLTEKIVFDEKVWPKVAELIARFHCLKVDGFKSGIKEPYLPLEKMRSVFAEMKPRIEERAKTDVRFKEWLDLIGDMNRNYDFLKTIVPPPDDKIVFIHGDLNKLNIIFNKNENSVKLIDFDLANHGYQAFDIAYHFVMACGQLTNYDPLIYPNEDLRFRWIRHYLKTFYEVKGIEVTDLENEVLELEKRVMSWTVYHHLTIGSVLPGMAMQDKNKTIGLDPLAVSFEHIKEFFRKKEAFNK